MDDRENTIEGLSISVRTERRLRMVVLGATGTGKTQLVSGFMGKQFSDVYNPTIEGFHRMLYTIKDQTYLLEILETSGRNVNPLTQPISLVSGDLYLIVYSVTSKASLDYAKEMLQMVLEAKRSLLAADVKSSWKWRGKQKRSMKSVPILLAGNKVDLTEERIVFHEDVEKWLQENADPTSMMLCQNIDVSAKDASSTQHLFERLFLLSHLPLEMSPKLHRKVTQEKFVENMKNRQNKSSLFSRIRTDGKLENLKSSLRRHRKDDSTIKSFSAYLDSATSSSTGSSDSDDSAGCDVTDSCETVKAIATVCPSQRRPSAATEVSRFLDKSKKSNYEVTLPIHWSPNRICTHSGGDEVHEHSPREKSYFSTFIRR